MRPIKKRGWILAPGQSCVSASSEAERCGEERQAANPTHRRYMGRLSARVAELGGALMASIEFEDGSWKRRVSALENRATATWTVAGRQGIALRYDAPASDHCAEIQRLSDA